MFCGEITSNFVDDSEYDDKSCQCIMNGQRGNHSTVELSGLASGWSQSINQSINLQSVFSLVTET